MGEAAGIRPRRWRPRACPGPSRSADERLSQRLCSSAQPLGRAKSRAASSEPGTLITAAGAASLGRRAVLAASPVLAPLQTRLTHLLSPNLPCHYSKELLCHILDDFEKIPSTGTPLKYLVVLLSCFEAEAGLPVPQT